MCAELETSSGVNTPVQNDGSAPQKNYPTGKIDTSGFDRGKAHSLDNEILAEENYYGIVEKVIIVSEEQLKKDGEKKRELRDFFTYFFSYFIFCQFIVLLILIFLSGSSEKFSISDVLLTTYIVSVFVETLGIIAAMVAFVFNSEEEVKIIDILNAVIANYQKPSKKGSEKDANKK